MAEHEVPGTARDGVLVRLRTRTPGFTGALRRVARQVLADPSGTARAGIVELAERSGTSPSTVTRFCRALGFDGYAQLRLAIAADTGPGRHAAGWNVDIGREIEPADPLDRVLGQIVASDDRAMRDSAALLDLGAVRQAADAIATARRVDVYGASGSALVGTELQYCLHLLGVPAWSWIDVHDGRASAALLGTGDVAVGISHSGRTRETVDAVAHAGRHGATTVAVTSYPGSALAQAADIVLQTAAQATTYRPDALSARHPQLVLLDLLHIAVAQRLAGTTPAPAQSLAPSKQGGTREA